MKTIIVPTDFSESSFNAALYAANFTHRFHVSTIMLYHSNTAPTRATELSMLHEHTKDILESFKQRILPYVHDRTQIDIRTDELPVAAAIEKITARCKADLIVMGTTGKNNFEKTIEGSNTVTVAKECSAPLLLIPPKTKFEEIKKLGFATDLKDVSATTPVDAIRKFLTLFKARLSILNVSTSENPGAATQQELSTLQHFFEKEQPEYHQIKTKGVVGGLMKFAIENRIQLLAFVTKKHGFLESIFHHSMTSDIAYHTYLPVLLLKQSNA